MFLTLMEILNVYANFIHKENVYYNLNAINLGKKVGEVGKTRVKCSLNDILKM